MRRSSTSQPSLRAGARRLRPCFGCPLAGTLHCHLTAFARQVSSRRKGGQRAARELRTALQRALASVTPHGSTWQCITSCYVPACKVVSEWPYFNRPASQPSVKARGTLLVKSFGLRYHGRRHIWVSAHAAHCKSVQQLPFTAACTRCAWI